MAETHPGDIQKESPFKRDELNFWSDIPLISAF